jgi:hypothetical protein
MRLKQRATAVRRKKERGNVMAYTVLSALFLFFAVGLGVDLSHLYLVKAELQNAADAGALAGASALTLPFDNPDRISTAVDRALMVMNRNQYNFDNRSYTGVMSLADQRDLVEFSVNLNDEPYLSEAQANANPDNIRFIRVKTPRVPVTTFFAIPFLGPQGLLDAKATAGLSVPGNANYCPLPLAAVECGANPACALERPGRCNAGGPMPNPDGTACDPAKQLCRNCDYVIRVQPGPGIAPGNFQALCCGGSTCNNTWLRLAIAGTQNCVDCPPVNPGEPLAVNFDDTNPGQKQAAIRDGLNTRLDCYGPSPTCGGEAGGGINPTDHPPDPNVFGRDGTDSLTWDQYQASNPSQNPAHTPFPDRRKLIVPVTSYDAWAGVEGRGTVEVSNFGAFFLKQRVPPGSGPNAGDVWAEYIGPEVSGSVGYDPTNPNTTNVVTPVLYR